jgi:hypothetical protein
MNAHLDMQLDMVVYIFEDGKEYKKLFFEVILMNYVNDLMKLLKLILNFLILYNMCILLYLVF